MNRNIVTKRIDAILKPVGFARRGRIWNRASEGRFDVLDIQFDRHSDAFTLNAGVLDTEVHRTTWGDSPEEFVEAAKCTVSSRVGYLVGETDVWWKLSEAEERWPEIQNGVGVVLDFFQQMSTRGTMINWLKDKDVTNGTYAFPIISLAVLQSMEGWTEDSLKTLDNLASKVSGPVLDWVQEIHEKVAV
jgi:hypothetical protein